MSYFIPKGIENATAELNRRQVEKNKRRDIASTDGITVATPTLQATEGLLYFGNPHESIPLRLISDPYLTPKAKFAWQVIKLNAKAYQGTAFPSYEELQQLLSERPYSSEKASPKVVSQVLLLLRLSRWLTFCETARNAQGQVLGNIYIIHDEPIGIMDALHFNDDYLGFVEKHCHHHDKLVSQAANKIMHDLLNDDTLSHYGAHIHLMRSRYMARHHQLDVNTPSLSPSQPKEPLEAQLEKVQENLLTSHTEDSKFDREVSQKTTNLLTSHTEDSKNPLSSNTGIRDKSLILDSLPLGKSASQYSTSTYINNNLYSTVLDEMEKQFPQIYMSLSTLEKNTLLKISKELNLSQRLFCDVLSETALRIQHALNTDNAIKNILGYLCKMLRNAANGQFKPYLIQQETDKPAFSSIAQPTRINSSPSKINKTNVKAVITKEHLNRRLEMAQKMRGLLKQKSG